MKPTKYQYSFMVRKLRVAVGAMEVEIRRIEKKGGAPPSDLLDRFLQYLQEIDRVEGEPALREIEAVKKELGDLRERVATIESSRAALKAYGRSG